MIVPVGRREKSMSVDVKMIKKLRERTGAGMMDCKQALMQTDGEEEPAVEYLRKKGIAKAAKRAAKAAREGVVEAYIHPGAKLGVLVEINCETDFVAKTDKFKVLVHDIAMQIAAADPISVSRDDMPSELIEKEKSICMEQARNTGKPEHILDKIATGMLEKYYVQNCLLEQEYVKDSTLKVSDVIGAAVSSLGENISVKRFTRYKLGE